MPSFKVIGSALALSLAAAVSAHPAGVHIVDGEVYMRCEVIPAEEGPSGGNPGGDWSEGGNNGGSDGGDWSEGGNNGGSHDGGNGGSDGGNNGGSHDGGNNGGSDGGNNGGHNGGNGGGVTVTESWGTTYTESWATTATETWATTEVWATTYTADGTTYTEAVTYTAPPTTVTEVTTIVSTLPPSTVVASATSVVESAATSVPTGGCGCTLSEIIVDVSAQILPHCNELTYLTSANITIEVVTQITTEITTILGVAIEQVNGITTSPLDIVVGLLDISVLAQVIGSILVIVFTALGVVLNLIATVDCKIDVELCTQLLVNVGVSCTALIKAVLACSGLGGLVGQLISIIVGVVFEVTYIIKGLGLVELTGCLGL